MYADNTESSWLDELALASRVLSRLAKSWKTEVWGYPSTSSDLKADRLLAGLAKNSSPSIPILATGCPVRGGPANLTEGSLHHMGRRSQWSLWNQFNSSVRGLEGRKQRNGTRCHSEGLCPVSWDIYKYQKIQRLAQGHQLYSKSHKALIQEGRGCLQSEDIFWSNVQKTETRRNRYVGLKSQHPERLCEVDETLI